MTALVAAEKIEKRFGGGRTLLGRPKLTLHAVRGVDLVVYRGETLGVVGESGCGKSTLARVLIGLDRASSGSVRIDGTDPRDWQRGNTRTMAKTVQYVFQDPVAALNPRKTVSAILEAPMIHLLCLDKARRDERAVELMDAVGLPDAFLNRYPHELSGGQAQRIGIARALAARPRLIVLDEPVSALDVSVQAQILNLLAVLQARFGLTYIFISHDLSVVESVSDRVAVMYFGRIVECAPAREIFRRPRHPYTQLLIDAAPIPGQKSVAKRSAPAELPDPYAPPPGCAFAPRCPNVQARCSREQPDLSADRPNPSHVAACFYPLENESGAR
jgi:oligopeptide/dipeptide ABC transporter ATP-binding protein